MQTQKIPLMRNIITTSVFLLLSFVFVQAQPIRTSTPEAMMKEGEEKLEQKDYYRALELFEKAYKEKSTKNNELAYRISNLHYSLRDYNKAEKWFGRVINKKYRKGTNPYLPDLRLEYGKVLKMNGKYQEAIEELRLYISEAEDVNKIKVAKNELAGAQMAVGMQDITGMTVVNAGKKVNTKYPEYSPVKFGNQMYFAAMRADDIIVLDGKNKDYHSKIFTSSKSEDAWSKPVALDNDNIHRDGYHVGNLSISKDGSTMYFTRAKLDGNDLLESKIFFSRMGDDGWGPANEVEGVNGDYIAKHPAPGELFGDEVLFFTSNMEGGYGGFDIYYSSKRGGTYGPPVNLGEVLNSFGNEETPFYRDGTLHFSSTSHPGLGGYDVFSTIWNGSNWTNPENMGKPYNSPVDDLYFSIDEEGYEGFVVSNRIGGRSVKSKTCCDDIWTINIEKVILDMNATTLASNAPLNGATVELISMQDGSMGETEAKTNDGANLFAFTLKPDMAYRVIAKRDGFFPDTIEFNTVGISESTTFDKTLNLTPIPPPPPPPVEPEYETFTTNTPIELSNIYYDLARANILPEAEKDLNTLLELMTRYSDMVIELSSHTDVRGKDAYNQGLSQRRAQSAMDWLVTRGVSSDRIKAVGYGETQVRNHCLEGVKCSDDEHRYNRRTEFKIISGPTTIQIEKKRLKKN